MKPVFFNLLIIVLFAINLNGQNLKVYNDLFTPAKTKDAAQSRNAAINYLEINKKSVKDLFKAIDKSCVMKLPFSNEKVITLDLIETNIFTEDFKLTNALDQVINLKPGRHFQGRIRGEETSFVAVSVFEDQIFGLMSDKNGNYNLGKVKNSEQYAFYNANESGFDINHACHVVDKRPENDIPFESLETRNAKTVNLYAEVDNDIVTAMGGVTQATNYVTAMYNQFIILYAQDGITFKLSGLKVWNTPSPYLVTPGIDDTEDYLNEFMGKSDGFNGHVAQLLTFQEIDGGLATGFHALCAPNPDSSKCVLQIYGTFENVPTYSWDVSVAAHEVGHLLGSRHTHACVWNGNNTAIDGCAGFVEGDCAMPGNPAGGGTIMSYCDNTDVGVNLTLGFGPQPKNYIINRINNAACVTDGGSGTLSVDPTFVEIPEEGGCKSVNVTATGAWGAEYDPNYPPFFLTDPFNIAGNGNGAIEFCAGKNTLPVPFYSVMYVYNGTTEIPVIIRQDSVHAPTAVFYPANEKISPFSGETFSLDILTNTDWKLIQKEYDQKWVKIKSSKSGTKNSEFTVEVTKNTTPLNRYSRITMVYNNGLDTTYFTISQPSENSGYLNVPDEFTASGSASSYQFRVSSDLDWEITDKPAWAEVTPMKGKKDQIVTVDVADNNTGNPQYGTITFVAKTISNDSIVKTVSINQLKMRSTESEITDRIYPNPTRDIVKIEVSAAIEEKLDVRIFDAAGRLIKILENNRPVFGAYYSTYHISDLAPGFYTMDIRHGASVLKEKLVILN